MKSKFACVSVEGNCFQCDLLMCHFSCISTELLTDLVVVCDLGTVAKHRGDHRLVQANCKSYIVACVHLCYCVSELKSYRNIHTFAGYLSRDIGNRKSCGL